MSHGYGASYVAEDQDYSESECPDGQMLQHLGVDITELYRRKHASGGAQLQNPPPPSPYYHTHFPGYYEGQNRMAAACGCGLLQDPRYCHQYKMIPHDQDHLYRSMSHAPPNLRGCQDPVYHKPPHPPQLKKYPVTARTPRYYRHAALCKRPSTLCLPLTCQPDPAVFRSRKPSPEVQLYKGQEVYTTHQDASIKQQNKKLTEPHQIDSEGDVNSRLNDLENLLTKFDDPDDNQENDPVEITGVSDIAKILKPRVPSSIRARQNKILLLKAGKPSQEDTLPLTSDVSKLEVKEFPESLEMVYRRLSDANVSTTAKEDANASDRSSEKNDDENQSKPFLEARSPKPFSNDQKPSLDDNSALELHRSKSYIVSLIDKALSKELGTVPGDKCTRKEFLNMNPKRAIDLVNRHTVNKSFEKASGSSETQSCNAQTKTDCASYKNEEPLYLKQLKQLRWSHLRHIQREAKRLADLERFLDSFGEGDSPP